jgi:hypothetical protein
MDFNNIANMKLSDFENWGQAEYNKGYKAALETMSKLLSAKICEDFNADGACDHQLCVQNFEIANGLDKAIANIS